MPVKTEDQIITWLDQSASLNNKIRKALLQITAAKQAPEIIDVPDSPPVIEFMSIIRNIFSKLPQEQYPKLYLNRTEVARLLGIDDKAYCARIMRSMGYRVTKSRRFTYPIWDKKENRIEKYAIEHSACYELDRDFFEEPKAVELGKAIY